VSGSGSGGGGSGGSGGAGGSGGSGGVSGTGGSGGSVGTCGSTPTYNSKATHYTLATPLVHCSYPTASLPQYYAALNEQDYASAAMCGACVRVTGPRGSVEVQIVDECPYQGNEQWCYPGSHHVDLNQNAFSQVGDLGAGVVDISWQIIPCNVQGSLSFTFKEGSSVYWSAVMVRNHRYRITKVEYRNATSGYKTLARQEYNYWLDEGGFGQGPYAFRITDVNGSVIEQTGIASLTTSALGSPLTVPGSVQLPVCQ
jgi:expansin (peptidoglycan-binding protein)